MNAENHVISASRRTDIPAFYGEWFTNRLKAGYACYRNPFNGKALKVSLKPEDVSCFVFWSKNFIPFMENLRQVTGRGYRYYCHYTVTGHPAILERNTPSLESVLKNFEAVSRATGPQYIIWRFDPVILTKEMTGEYYLRKFAEIARKLEEYTQSCYISMVSLYKKTVRNLAKQGIVVSERDEGQEKEIAGAIGSIGRQHGIQVYSCCCDFLNSETVQKGSCIDIDVIRSLTGEPDLRLQKAPSRKQCGCYKSYDIGSYGTCINGCAYCYATGSFAAGVKSFNEHKPQNEFLI